jgi:hypothetical protein
MWLCLRSRQLSGTRRSMRFTVRSLGCALRRAMCWELWRRISILTVGVCRSLRITVSVRAKARPLSCAKLSSRLEEQGSIPGRRSASATASTWPELTTFRAALWCKGRVGDVSQWHRVTWFHSSRRRPEILPAWLSMIKGSFSRHCFLISCFYRFQSRWRPRT